MPVLNWLGKDKIVNHHNEVPYKVLNRVYSYDKENGKSDIDNKSKNMIIHGDNLLALKSLMPKYEGMVDVIYIDPPYNTAHSTNKNQKWVYSDNVDSPIISKWLNKVVGDEGEDLSRHDKWLCMMYPRLKLLYKLLKNDGVIFISCDDNELFNLKNICDEIFNKENYISLLSVENNPKGRKNSDYVSITNDYVLIYVKNKDKKEFIENIPSEINDIENIDLLSEDCPIRYIITVNALKEGWDCPFAYILASVSNRNSNTEVEQIIGRVLRQPYVEKTKFEGLNISYVLTCSDDFSNTANSVIKGLEKAGYSKNDVRIETNNIEGDLNNNVSQNIEETEISINEDGTIDFEKLFNIEENRITVEDKDKAYEMTNTNIDTDLINYTESEKKKQEIENLEKELKEKLAEYDELTNNGINKTNGAPMDKTYIANINEEFKEEIENLKLPMFAEEMSIPISESEDNFVKFDKEHLNSTFNLNTCDCNINFSFGESDMQKIDLNEKGVIKTNYVSKNEKELIRKMFFSQIPVKQRILMTETIANIINSKENSIPIQHIVSYVARIFDSKKDENMTDVYTLLKEMI